MSESGAHLVVVEELGDDVVGARVDLFLEILDVLMELEVVD
jgi:hypothetical protein